MARQARIRPGLARGRRRLLAAALACAIWMPAGGLAQPRARKYRIGWMSGGSAESVGELQEVMRELRRLGYRDDEIELQARFAEGHRERLDGMAAELVALGPDVIFAGATPGTMAARRATSIIPIVFAGVSDPIGAGFVRTLGRPGGNVTGISNFALEMASKPLELLREVVPKARWIGVLASDNPGMVPVVSEMQAVAARLGLQVQVERAETLPQIEAAFASLARARVDGLVVISDAAAIVNRARISELAAMARLPAIYSYAAHVEDGGLMSYGPNPGGLMRQVVGYIDRILKGGRPGEIPVQGPAEFELALNLDAARALGIAFPREVLLRANKVVGRR